MGQRVQLLVEGVLEVPDALLERPLEQVVMAVRRV